MTADEAYENAAHIPGGADYFDAWAQKASAFRDGHTLKEVAVSYGAGAAQTYDIYHPDHSAKGTVVFVHGGYWKACAPSVFSHLAAGSLAAGYAFAMPRYTLAPDARIATMAREIVAAIGAIAQRSAGPIYFAGHSAGGHLVARAVCGDVAGDWLGRVARVMPISPLGDLAPLMETSMNEVLGIDPQEAQAESPVRHPAPGVPVHVWVGASERPAFLQQAQGFVDAWACTHTIVPQRHHFDIIEGLEDRQSPLMRALLS